ncbi:hypothetical protein FNZ56_09935 [Pseudoluteimonas lycopersici]|uniref:Uncharacterized protein n=1 Tax=Pseudoluteimonas lycopersici TaxID=1324796 RepID=A0A516V6M1_9GAMM|nr:hypothetical protein [Lysobacter lycopersici]QDQ74176.1 hypothetical protein FNZ56_09935 [Lysobacter lycopersici]
MLGEIESWDNGWHGVSLGMSTQEIDQLIALLLRIRDDPNQHFHISGDYSGSGGIGDIEFYVSNADTNGNLHLSGLALPPGDQIPVR